ncbi:MAG: DMT family transporter [Proteobacteria bacterium]|nr:DMT family transporter [Pseudomonadota bacterium]
MLVVVLFSGFTLISRFGLTTTMTFPELAALRFGVGGLLLLPVLFRYGLSGLNWRQAAWLAFLGGLGFAMFAYSGFLLAPAAHGAVLLHGTLPLFTFLILTASPKTAGQRTSRWSVILIASGVALMAWDSIVGASARQIMGDVLLLAASLSWSAYGVTVRRLGLVPIRAAAIVAALSMCCYLPIYAALAGPTLFAVDWQDLLLQGVFQGVLIGAVSIFVYTSAVTILGVSETATFTAAVPCATTIGAIPLLSEWPNATTIGGVVIVTAGMLIAARTFAAKR